MMARAILQTLQKNKATLIMAVISACYWRAWADIAGDKEKKN
jgi:hypothetical protein